MNPKLNSSVSVVKASDNLLEFFKSNTRQQICIKVKNDTILNIVLNFNGEKSISQLSEEYNVDYDSLQRLINFLSSKGIMDSVESKSDFKQYDKFRRVINFLGDYSQSHQQLVDFWENIRKATVLIVGLGAVGSWTACNLAQSGVQNFILMDADTIEISNLHRQFGYNENSVGMKKVDVMEKTLSEYNQFVKVKKMYKFLDESSLDELAHTKIDLIINCADKPNVDTTSLWVGKFGMEHNIPHIVGGGYNLHLSLIGQTVIPGKTACAKCFQKQLEEDNRIDTERVKKLAVKNRKVGSFGPMCSIIASMIGMEAIKVLSKCTEPANINRRGEFDIYSMEIKYKTFLKRKDCEWCGSSGIYYNKECDSQ